MPSSLSSWMSVDLTTSRLGGVMKTTVSPSVLEACCGAVTGAPAG